MTTATGYPTTLDGAGTFTPGAGTDPLQTNDHSLVHENIEANLLEFQARIGVASSTVATSHEYRIGVLETARAGRNYVINGNMSVWQRGDGPFAADGYTADQWKLYNGTGATNAIQRSLLALGSTGNAKWSMQWNRTVAGSTSSIMQHHIEGVQRLAGKTVTVSFCGKGNATISFDVQMQQYFGTGGSPSTIVVLAAQTVQVTTSTAQYSLQFVLPSVSGKTLGTVGDYLAVDFARTAAQANGAIDIWNIQVEEGPVASPYENESYGETLAKCQRYFQRYSGVNKHGVMIGFSTTLASGLLTLYAPMRVTPNITVTTVGGLSLNNSGSVACTAIAADTDVSASAYSVICTVASGLTAGAAYWLKSGASGSIDLSAEL